MATHGGFDNNGFLIRIALVAAAINSSLVGCPVSII